MPINTYLRVKRPLMDNIKTYPVTGSPTRASFQKAFAASPSRNSSEPATSEASNVTENTIRES